MRGVVPATYLVLVAATAGGLAIAEDRQHTQAGLDAACEAARQAALVPKKEEIYRECIQKFKKSAAVCEEEADGYNGSRAGRAPLFYDLPECEAAFEYRKND